LSSLLHQSSGKADTQTNGGENELYHRNFRQSCLTTSQQLSTFYPRDAMLARYLLSLCVRPSVRLSQADIVPKRLNVG